MEIFRYLVFSLSRSEFHHEVKILSRLKDPNIVRVLGVCTQGEPLAVIIEYMKFGDLHQFLLAHVPDTAHNQHKQANLLRCSHACTHTHTYTCTHACTYACTPAHACSHTHKPRTTFLIYTFCW